MAINILIFGLIIISFVINLLALGAFWITPGIRTTAHRFTINLLISNLIGSLLLLFTLIFCGSNELDVLNTIMTETTRNDGSVIYLTQANHQMNETYSDKSAKNGAFNELNYDFNPERNNSYTMDRFYKCSSTLCRKLNISKIRRMNFFSEMEKNDVKENMSFNFISPKVQLRYWSIDMAAALGALSVLLVVGDTWCAVTDPLRYHSRISIVKSWTLIAITWMMGLIFGALSAFRIIEMNKQIIFTVTSSEANYVFTSTYGTFSIIFSCSFFVVIILLPFGFICGMYWQIFSEARESGLRMRQNGSSPLLQSALNLTHQQTSLMDSFNVINCAQLSSNEQQMEADYRNVSSGCLRRNSVKALLPTVSDDGLSNLINDGDIKNEKIDMPRIHYFCGDRTQNILLTLQSPSDEIKRNYSECQLTVWEIPGQDMRKMNSLQGIRQVHSAPNLQMFAGKSSNFFGHHKLCHAHSQRLMHMGKNAHGLQVPIVSNSPKTLSYMSSLRHRLSNASSLFKYREESRAARISVLVVFMFLVSYLPYGFLLLMQSRVSAAYFKYSTHLAIFLVILSNLCSPFIFAYRNKRVRHGVKRLLEIKTIYQKCSLQRQSCFISRPIETLYRQNKNPKNNIIRSNSKMDNHSVTSCKSLTIKSSLQNNKEHNEHMDNFFKVHGIKTNDERTYV